jgi:hypothetical protein
MNVTRTAARRLHRTDPTAAAARMTAGARQWLAYVMANSPEVQNALVAIGPVDFQIVLLGTYSRAEMAPYSDMDFVILSRNPAAMAPLAAAFAGLVGLVGAARGGINFDPAVNGEPCMDPQGLDLASENRDMAVAYTRGADHQLLREAMTFRRWRVRGPDLLGLLAQRRKERWDAIAHPKVSLLANLAKDVDFDIDVKAKLLRFLIVLTSLLAEYVEYFEAAANAPPAPMSTVARLAWLCEYGPPDLRTALGASALLVRLRHDFVELQSLRFDLHFANGREVDRILASRLNPNWVRRVIEDFRAYNAALEDFLRKRL